MRHVILLGLLLIFLPLAVFSGTETLEIKTILGGGGGGAGSTTGETHLATDSGGVTVGYSQAVIPAAGDLIVAGRVGIKTEEPVADLDIEGSQYVLGGTGDVDGNNKVGANDLLIVLKYLNAAGTLSKEQYARADVNGDGRVNALDKDLISKLITNEITLEEANHDIGKAISDRAIGIDYNGNVGIGEAAPGLKLHVSGNEGLPASEGIIQNGHTRLGSGDLVLDIGTIVSPAWGAWLQTNNKTDLSQKYNLLLNPSGGNVGIGTTAPFQKLAVKGSVIIHGAGDGDVDLSGKITANDTLLASQAANGIVVLDPIQFIKADVDGDGVITQVGDVTAIQRLSVGRTRDELGLPAIGGNNIYVSGYVYANAGFLKPVRDTGLIGFKKIRQDESIILCEDSSKDYSVYLPSAENICGKEIIIKKTNKTSTVTVKLVSGQKIDGADSYEMNATWQYIRV